MHENKRKGRLIGKSTEQNNSLLNCKRKTVLEASHFPGK